MLIEYFSLKRINQAKILGFNSGITPRENSVNKMRKLRQPFIFLSHFFNIRGFLKINVSDKYLLPKNFSACKILGRMSLILIYKLQLSEQLVSTQVKHQPL